MKFNEAFDAAFEVEEKRLAQEGKKFAITPATAKTLAFFWNIMAAAQNSFEDFAYITEDNQVKSIPIEPIEPGEKTKKGKKPSTAADNVGGDGPNNETT